MAKNKHKHKGAQAQTVNDNNKPINEQSKPSKAVFDSGIFAAPTKSGGANVVVSGDQLFGIVVAQYGKLAQTPTITMPNDKSMGEFVAHMATKHFAVMPNGYMAFDVSFLAGLHGVEIDANDYKKGNGLQCYITAIGTTANKTGKASGMCARLLKTGYTVIDKQYTTHKRAFMGRMWVIRKPQPTPTDTKKA